MNKNTVPIKLILKYNPQQKSFFFSFNKTEYNTTNQCMSMKLFSILKKEKVFFIFFFQQKLSFPISVFERFTLLKYRFVKTYNNTWNTMLRFIFKIASMGGTHSNMWEQYLKRLYKLMDKIEFSVNFPEAINRNTHNSCI